MGEYEIIEEEGIIDEPLLIDQKYWVVKESDKIEALVRIIDMSPDFYGLVFTQTKMDADNVTKMLDLRGYSAAALHGDIMQNQLEKVLERFRMKKTRILVATDVAARGIDITGLSHVVNYSLPFDGATYVHRIGRTGRAGSTGIAVTLVRPEERRKLGFLQSAIAKASKGKMTEEKIPTIHDVLEIKQQRIIKTLQETLFTITSQQVQQEEFATSIPTEQDELSEISESTEQITQETSEVQTIETKTPIEVSEFFANMAQDLCKEQDAQKVLAAVLATVYGEQLSPKHYGRISVQKDFGKQDDMSRIYVQLGKKDGLRPKDIAEFFSNMLHIPGRQVDQIDMAREFTLVSLPKASARKAIEMSKSNKKIPHMHPRLAKTST